jgi:hypothetical protein
LGLNGLADDSEYRARWVDFHLADGTTIDSRRTNWRNVEWEKVVKQTMWIRGIKHEVDCQNKPGFKGFLHFRCGGAEAVFEHGTYKNHKRINTWVIGWTDGRLAYLKEIDFKTGKLIRFYTKPVKELNAHIHPRIRHLFTGKSHASLTTI